MNDRNIVQMFKSQVTTDWEIDSTFLSFLITAVKICWRTQKGVGHAHPLHRPNILCCNYSTSSFELPPFCGKSLVSSWKCVYIFTKCFSYLPHGKRMSYKWQIRIYATAKKEWMLRGYVFSLITLKNKIAAEQSRHLWGGTNVTTSVAEGQSSAATLYFPMCTYAC